MTVPAVPKPTPPAAQLRRCGTCQATTPHDPHCPGPKCPWWTCRVCHHTRDAKGRTIAPRPGNQ